MTVPAIYENTGEGRQYERGYLPRETDNAQEERGSGQAVDEPTGGDTSHPRSNERDALATEKESIVFMTERA
jgi:hypothetical protein